MKIGVFDSGVGGLSVVNAIKKQLPELEIVYKDDKEHVPYGTREIEQIHQLVRPIFQSFVDENCLVIVVACNTVTTNLISKLRGEFKVPMIGMEPMVKPAAKASKSKIITICATPKTLSSDRFKKLKADFAKGIKVLEPDCSEWAQMVEENTLNRDKIANEINNTISQGSDQLVLGCTHYHWIESLIREIADGRAEVLQPEEPVIKQLKRVLAQLA